MSAVLGSVLELLPVYGPWLLLVLAILETCFVTGLVVPSGLATSAATVLALEGALDMVPLVVAAVCGAAIGDSLGFWVGRAWGEHVFREESRWSRALGKRLPVIDELFGRHPFYSVTVARLISFVRTVMPMAAGMSGISYRRYLAYEVPGVVGWATIYVAIGYFGRESWQVATQVVGVGGTLAFVFAGLVAWRVWRRAARGTDAPAEAS